MTIKITFPNLEVASSAFQLLMPIENLHAWLKDLNGQFVFTSDLFAQRFGFDAASKLVGLSDHDLAPPYLANRYIEDDQQVLQGNLITDQLELLAHNEKNASWFRTSKWPVYNLQGEIIGSYGVSKKIDLSDSQATPFHELNVPIEYIQKKYSESISVEKLAQACHASISTLERRFKKHLSKTPLQYIMEVRLDNARMMVFDSSTKMSNIAQETGFVDNSHFTRAYKKRFNISPSADRRQRIQKV